MNRTYVGDATEGADTMEDLVWILRDLEDIVANGGFTFKETLMSADAEGEPENPKKVLGLIWETERDGLRIDVKVNFSEKQRGARTAPEADLEEEMEDFAPEVINKRVLWRVAQGQYDPLGLLCVFTIQFKLLMRT